MPQPALDMYALCSHLLFPMITLITVTFIYKDFVTMKNNWSYPEPRAKRRIYVSVHSKGTHGSKRRSSNVLAGSHFRARSHARSLARSKFAHWHANS